MPGIYTLTDDGLLPAIGAAGSDATVNAANVAAAGAVMATATVTKLHGPITQAAYDALTPDADTLYVIVG